MRPVGLGGLLGTPSHSRATAAVAGGSNGSPGSMPTVQRTAAVSSSLILAPVARSCLAPESLCLPRPNCAVRRVRGARQESLTVYGTHPAGWNTSVRLWCGGEQVASVCRRNRGQQRHPQGQARPGAPMYRTIWSVTLTTTTSTRRLSPRKGHRRLCPLPLHTFNWVHVHIVVIVHVHIVTLCKYRSIGLPVRVPPDVLHLVNPLLVLSPIVLHLVAPLLVLSPIVVLHLVILRCALAA